MQKGKIIVIDGMDGCGKHTQSNCIYEKLKEKNEKVKIFSFPNYEEDSSFFVKKFLNGEYDEVIGDNIYIQSLFFYMDQSLSYHKHLKKLYEEGYTIILDRYYISNALYRLPVYNYFDTNKFLYFIQDVVLEKMELPKPDCTIILYSRPDISNKLISKRYENDPTKRDKYENLDIQNDVYKIINVIDYYKDGDMFKNTFGKIKTFKIHDDKGKVFSIEETTQKILEVI